MKSFEWCGFFQTLEQFPDCKVFITPEQEIEAANHLIGCDSCYVRTERMEAKYEGREIEAFKEISKAEQFRLNAGQN